MLAPTGKVRPIKTKVMYPHPARLCIKEKNKHSLDIINRSVKVNSQVLDVEIKLITKQ